MSELIKTNYDKLLVGLGAALLAVSGGWMWVHQVDITRLRHQPVTAELAGAAYAVTGLRLPEAKTAAWPKPVAQSQGSGWLYEVFTPPVIYYNPLAKSFTVTPPMNLADGGAPFGLELVDVNFEPYRLQLVGYFGAPGDFLAAFVSPHQPETWLARSGRRFDQLGLTLKSFDVKKVVVAHTDAWPVYDVAALAVLFDEKSGTEVVLDSRARKHLMIAGGIGITPFLAQIGQVSHLGGRFELHYAARNRGLAAYMAELTAAHGDRVQCYFDEEGMAIDLKGLLGRQPIGTHLYVCGPKGMLNWVRATAGAAGWPVGAVHFEEFLAPGSGQVFTAELALSGKTVTVGTHQSLLEAIEAAGVDAPYLCRGGACGQCETTVLRCDGQLLHRDHWLTPEDLAAGQKIMPCVSRFEGTTLILER